jgi:antitoxin (DNA-binding transcriptional repressor) of toxin-antitoxin stability system
MPAQSYSVSEARARLSGLIKAIRQEPGAVFSITVNGVVVAELRAPEAERARVEPGDALLEALEKMGEPEIGAEGPVARNHDEHLYRG